MRKLMLVAVLVSAPVFGQDPPAAPTIEVGASGYVVDQTEVTPALFRGWVQANAVNLPLPGDAVTGVIVEAGWDGGFTWAVWSTNETEIKNIIMGTHLRVMKGGPVSSQFDFDLRLVAGYRFGPNLALRFYGLDEQADLGIGVSYRF